MGPIDHPPLAIDPGAKYFGWARGDWQTKRITACGLHWMANLHEWPPWFRPGAFHVIVETQLPTKHDPATRKAILALARMVGACEARGATSERVEVAMWKGQVHKKTSHKAILAAMDADELQLYHDTCNNYTGASKTGEYLINEELDLDSRYDVSHASGVLLWRFKRFVI